MTAQYDTDLEAALDSARTVMTLSSRDWATSHDVAWLWGLLVGWDDDPTAGDVDQDNAMGNLAARFRWSPDDVARLRRLRAAIELASRGSASPVRTTPARYVIVKTRPGIDGATVVNVGAIAYRDRESAEAAADVLRRVADVAEGHEDRGATLTVHELVAAE